MVQLAVRCQPIAPISTDELQGWLELEVHELRAAAPRGTVRLSRLTQGGQTAHLEIGWLVELEVAEDEPLLGEDRLADALRDMRLLGLEPTLLVQGHVRAGEGRGNGAVRTSDDVSDLAHGER
ncbi:MAG: hypothetical protein ACRDN8_25735 [Thermoleophilaceae bacterium]